MPKQSKAEAQMSKHRLFDRNLGDRALGLGIADEMMDQAMKANAARSEARGTETIV